MYEFAHLCQFTPFCGGGNRLNFFGDFQFFYLSKFLNDNFNNSHQLAIYKFIIISPLQDSL